MLDQNQLSDVMGQTAYDSDGDKIGKIGQIYVDDETGQASWLTVSTGFFGSKETFIPAGDASMSGDRVTVPFDKQTIKDAPNIDADGHLEPAEEAELYRYYGMSQGVDQGTVDQGTVVSQDTVQTTDAPVVGDYDRTVDTDRGAGHDTSGPNTDDAMTRSEERLNVGTERVQTGKARMRKFIVTENVSRTVPVSHEEVTLEREAITDANMGDAMSGGDLTTEEHEVTLHAERAVVSKETVPVERVRLNTETVTSEQTVNEEVRKEQIEMVDDNTTDRTTTDRTTRTDS